jgi:hypothetical protein
MEFTYFDLGRKKARQIAVTVRYSDRRQPVIHSVKAEPGKEPRDWKVLTFADVGSNELFQMRFADLWRYFQGGMWPSEQQEKIRDAFWSMVLEGFTPPFMHLRQAIKLSSDPKTPILNLRNEYHSFYSTLWTAYRHRFDDLLQSMGYKASFIFADKDATSQKEGANFAERHNIGSDVIAHIAENRSAWQNKLSKIRNRVIAHPQIPRENAAVIYQPSTAQAYFDHCWQTAEWFAAVLLAKHLSPSVELGVLPDEMTDGGKRRFAVQVKPHVRFIRPGDATESSEAGPGTDSRIRPSE